MDLNGKKAVVTGASSGIGSFFSKALIEKGAIVYGLARSIDKMQKLQKQLGGSFIPVEMDVTEPDLLEEWVEATFDRNNLPDILINNAGVGYFGEVDEQSIDDWDTMLKTNLSGIFYITRLIVPLLKQNRSVCHIINISSIAGKIGNPQISGYNATKFGVRGFSEALFKELRYDGIKVTCLYPGSIATRFFDNAGDADTHPNMMQPDDVADVLINVLETPDNFLISDVTMRPLNPKPPEEE